MTDPAGGDRAGQAAALAAVHREFVEGLPERLAVLRAALARLAGDDHAEPLATLRIKAHALKGTAAAFGAAAVSDCARAVEDRAHEWVRRGAVPREELAAAEAELGRLEQAVAAYAAASGSS